MKTGAIALRLNFTLNLMHSLALSLALGSTCASAVASAVASTAATTTIRADDARIVRTGRTVVQDDGSVRFAYPGVTMALAFTGKALAFDAWASGEQSYIEVVIDGAAPRVIRLKSTRQTIALLAGDKAGKPGKHLVEVMHRSETWHGTVTVAAFAVEGKVSAAPALPKRKMMVLGDSITCGEAVDRVDGDRVDGGKKDASWWNPRFSYGMLAARALDAQVHLVCHGGRGLVRSWNGKTDDANLPDFFHHAITDASAPVVWDHAGYNPDLIVVAIGTNDFSPGIADRDQYVQTYVKLVQTLMRNHRHARIVLTGGAILKGEKKAALEHYIGETIKRVDSGRVRSALVGFYEGDATDGHPTKTQHADLARALVPHLKAATGW